MKRRYPILLSSALILSMLVGCSRHSSSAGSIPKSTPRSTPSEDISSGPAADSGPTESNLSMTYTDAKALYDHWNSIDFNSSDKNFSKYGAYYVKKADDTFYSLLPTMSSRYGSRVILLKDQEQSSVPTLSRSSGDSLILFSDSNYLNTVYLCTVTESGYTLPLSFGMYGFSASYAYSNISKNFEGIALDPNTLEVLPDSYTSTGLYSLHNGTLDGMSYDEIGALPNAIQDDVLSYIVSLDKGTSAHVEYYEGTAYGEANITADYFYLVLDSEWYEGFGNTYYDPVVTELPISLTKEGYAEVDISSLTPGYYAVPIKGSYDNFNHFSAHLSPFVIFQIVD